MSTDSELLAIAKAIDNLAERIENGLKEISKAIIISGDVVGDSVERIDVAVDTSGLRDISDAIYNVSAKR